MKTTSMHTDVIELASSWAMSLSALAITLVFWHQASYLTASRVPILPAGDVSYISWGNLAIAMSFPTGVLLFFNLGRTAFMVANKLARKYLRTKSRRIIVGGAASLFVVIAPMSIISIIDWYEKLFSWTTGFWIGLATLIIGFASGIIINTWNN